MSFRPPASCIRVSLYSASNERIESLIYLILSLECARATGRRLAVDTGIISTTRHVMKKAQFALRSELRDCNQKCR